MKDLKCGKKSCKFNKGYCCCAKEIEVAKSTDCLTFTPVEKNTNLEAGSDFVKSNYTVDTAVGCNADCIFQKSNKCVACGITVMGENNVASCLTFIKK